LAPLPNVRRHRSPTLDVEDAAPEQAIGLTPEDRGDDNGAGALLIPSAHNSASGSEYDGGNK
jgi:hypothetical protein